MFEGIAFAHNIRAIKPFQCRHKSQNKHYWKTDFVWINLCLKNKEHKYGVYSVGQLFGAVDSLVKQEHFRWLDNV